MKQIQSVEVLDEISICPYCGDEQGGKFVCCGEIHFETGYEVRVGGRKLSMLVTEAELKKLYRGETV